MSQKNPLSLILEITCFLLLNPILSSLAMSIWCQLGTKMPNSYRNNENTAQKNINIFKNINTRMTKYIGLFRISVIDLFQGWLYFEADSPETLSSLFVLIFERFHIALWLYNGKNGLYIQLHYFWLSLIYS